MIVGAALVAACGRGDDVGNPPVASESPQPGPIDDPPGVTAPGTECEKLPTHRERFDCLFEREVEPGTLAYDVPAQSRVGQSEQVTVRLSREDPEQIARSIEQGLDTSGPDGGAEPLDVTTEMRAALEGASAFDVEALTPEVQRLRQSGFGEWRWVVTPTQAGTHPLVLTVTALLGDEPLSHVVLERSITVEVNLGFSLRRWWSANWQWVLAPGGFAALLAGALLGRVRRYLPGHPATAHTATTAAESGVEKEALESQSEPRPPAPGG